MFVALGCASQATHSFRLISGVGGWSRSVATTQGNNHQLPCFKSGKYCYLGVEFIVMMQTHLSYVLFSLVREIMGLFIIKCSEFFRENRLFLRSLQIFQD